MRAKTTVTETTSTDESIVVVPVEENALEATASDVPEVQPETTVEQVLADAETPEGAVADTVTEEDNGDLTVTKDDVEFTVPAEAIVDTVEDADTDTILESDAPEVEFNEGQYLTANPDVQQAVVSGIFASGKDHYERFGKFEGR